MASFKAFKLASIAALVFVSLSNWAAPRVDKLPSGIQIEHSRVGTGASPKPTDKVTVNYRGTLTNGKEFDSSYKRGTPATFPLNGVIRCWTQGLMTMQVGGKATVSCPAITAYGPASPSPAIPPNSDLVFEIELLSIEP